MTRLTTTLFRVVKISGKSYVLGIHPTEPDTLLSIRPLGRRVPYVVPASTVRVYAALAYGRSENAAKRDARKHGVPWKRARGKFIASLVPPPVKRKKKDATA